MLDLLEMRRCGISQRSFLWSLACLDLLFGGFVGVPDFSFLGVCGIVVHLVLICRGERREAKDTSLSFGNC